MWSQARQRAARVRAQSARGDDRRQAEGEMRMLAEEETRSKHRAQRDMTLSSTKHMDPPPPAVLIQSRRRPCVREPLVFFSQ
eukprot:1184795-Prorocentrum_minimum.AAC.1